MRVGICRRAGLYSKREVNPEPDQTKARNSSNHGPSPIWTGGANLKGGERRLFEGMNWLGCREIAFQHLEGALH